MTSLFNEADESTSNLNYAIALTKITEKVDFEWAEINGLIDKFIKNSMS